MSAGLFSPQIWRNTIVSAVQDRAKSFRELGRHAVRDFEDEAPIDEWMDQIDAALQAGGGSLANEVGTRLLREYEEPYRLDLIELLEARISGLRK